MPVAVDDFATNRAAALRLLIFADANGPTQEISFLRPLAGLRGNGALSIRLIDEKSLDEFGARSGGIAVAALLRRQFEETDPTVVILSRFAGSDYGLIFNLARERRIPVICHLDDNLLDPPPALGFEIWRHLLQPRRVHALHEIVCPGRSPLRLDTYPRQRALKAGQAAQSQMRRDLCRRRSGRGGRAAARKPAAQIARRNPDRLYGVRKPRPTIWR